MERGHWSGMSCSLSAPMPHPMMLAIYLYSRASLAPVLVCVINIVSLSCSTAPRAKRMNAPRASVRAPCTFGCGKN